MLMVLWPIYDYHRKRIWEGSIVLQNMPSIGGLSGRPSYRILGFEKPHKDKLDFADCRFRAQIGEIWILENIYW